MFEQIEKLVIEPELEMETVVSEFADLWNTSLILK
jgi:hypothetical protein